MMGFRSSHHRQWLDSVRPRASSRRDSGLSRTVRRMTMAVALLAAIIAPEMRADSARCGQPAADSLVGTLSKQASTLSPDVLRLALEATDCATQQGYVKRRELLTVIDYSLPSTEPRLFVFDLGSRKLLFQELVAHGVNSGGNLTERFSNEHGSRQTSLGLFVTAEPYFGSNGYSLRLQGLEKGINDRARERAIVMHGAPYVNDSITRAQGRLGRSWGCPAVRKEVAKKMIDTLKGGSPIFAYYPHDGWLRTSRFLAR